MESLFIFAVSGQILALAFGTAAWIADSIIAPILQKYWPLETGGSHE